MRELRLYDKVLLNSGELAFISKIERQGVSYRAVIHTAGGFLVDTISHQNIVKVYPIQDAGRKNAG